MPASTAPSEFPDRFSPILVKELRQGLRTHIFVVSFMLVQAAMALLTIFSLASAQGGDSTEVTSMLVWTIIAAPLFLLLPMAGLNAIEQERRAGTLELILLTRLTARRILFGKWVGLVIQAILLVCTALPYVVLRYFMGGVNLADELVRLSYLLFLSVVLNGVAVSFSALPLWLTRVLMVLGGFIMMIGLFYASVLIMTSFGRVGGGFGLNRSTDVLAGCWVGLATLVFAWEFGSGLIAPEAENHSTPLRLLAVLNVGIAAGLSLAFPRLALFAFGVANLFSFLVCLGLLCEHPRLLPSIYRPFARWGFWGRCAGFFLYPGWPSALAFTLLMALLVGLTGQVTIASHSPADFWCFLLTMIGGLFFPFAVLRFFLPEVRRPFLFVFLFQIIFSAAVRVLAAVLAAVAKYDLAPLLRVIPGYAGFTHPSKGPGTGDFWSDWSPSLLTGFLCFSVLLWRALLPLRQMRACERLARA